MHRAPFARASDSAAHHSYRQLSYDVFHEKASDMHESLTKALSTGAEECATGDGERERRSDLGMLSLHCALPFF
jgi:hypothetical protein